MHRPLLPDRYHRTGRVRFRRGWWGQLVPQVELAVRRGEMPPPPGIEYLKEPPTRYEWRDALRQERDHLSRFYYAPQTPE